MTKRPFVPPELIRHLEEIFPDTCGEPHMTEKDLYIRMGSAMVVRVLRDIYDTQET